jgi:hypothetical protein
VSRRSGSHPFQGLDAVAGGGIWHLRHSITCKALPAAGRLDKAAAKPWQDALADRSVYLCTAAVAVILLVGCYLLVAETKSYLKEGNLTGKKGLVTQMTEHPSTNDDDGLATACCIHA